MIAKSALNGIMRLTLSDDYDPRVLGVPNTTVPEALKRLIIRGLIGVTRASESLTLEDARDALASMRRTSWSILEAIRLDDAPTFIVACGSLAAILELTQHVWETESDVSDSASLLNQCQLHYTNLQEAIAPIRKLLVRGESLNDSGFDFSYLMVIPARVDLLRALYLLGVSKRLERDRPIQMVASHKRAIH